MDSENSQNAVNNLLIPNVGKISAEEAEELCKSMGITKDNLPLIKLNDATLKNMEIEVGDIIKIHRKSWVADKETLYYRLVVP